MRDYGTTTEWHEGLCHRAPGLNEAILEAMTPGQAPETEGHAQEQYKPEPNGTWYSQRLWVRSPSKRETLWGGKAGQER